MKERLDKYISSQTGLSRREAVKAIRDKRVLVNGVLCLEADAKIDLSSDAVSLDGRALSYREHVYYMMNKPQDVVSATEDRQERTVLDILPEELRRAGLFPAGRLDKDTTGLLIITDDGDYAHRMLSPKKHVDKTYIATLDREPGGEIPERFAEGITLANGTACKPGRAELLDGNRVKAVIGEGKYHQVKRMFAALGYKVIALCRVRIGELELDGGLAPGEVREMTPEEADMVFV